ncbi:NAD-dependent epimerase/dehydratase family protein [Microbacterium sp. ET2]|uniref:NAD-dependent epimerase/dehydratase family protein n=1 Tax=Microbacterium albipurpureum TaxID=3050384 RepID=UPI00259C69A2|nr:NAD-dependent epimerase/dehydratase family protein [Microbacterium sp. ET2 (Ac-2212)]WJL95318.1 NAD-dependent epimerase/dehydratase family protein [Microbacterium sp. ET2 (Ac-2212)]
MTNVLILGGTGWLSGRVARAWVDAGARVTCLARGGRPAPEGAELVIADRSNPGAYDAVARREWDEVVEISSAPEHVSSAVAALAAVSHHLTYVSSLSVYAANDVVGADEAADVSAPLRPGEEYDYSRAKAAAEASVRDVFGDRAAIVRPGLIVGPDDPTDRFGYWVARVALAGVEPVLTPTLAGRMSQVIDVDDLAAFLVACGAARLPIVANAVGDPMPFRTLVDTAREVASHRGDLVEADDEWLVAHDVQFWMGPRSLPLWLPSDMPGFATRSNTAYRAAGGPLRDLGDTLRRTFADETARGLDRERRSGLTRAEEEELISARRRAE